MLKIANEHSNLSTTGISKVMGCAFETFHIFNPESIVTRVRHYTDRISVTCLPYTLFPNKEGQRLDRRVVLHMGVDQMVSADSLVF